MKGIKRMPQNIQAFHFATCSFLSILTLTAGLFSQVFYSVADETILVPRGSSWKYLDNGSNQGTAWKEPLGFDDSSWSSGVAQLGYGDGDEATILSYGGNSSSKHTTTYFRHAFNVSDPSAFVSLQLDLLRDDGAVVYLNGLEVRRDNMPSGSVTYTTFASSAIGGSTESTFFGSSIPVENLVAGSNILAVEIHQANLTSSDISFDLELIASTDATVIRGPYLQIGTPTSVIVRWRTDAATNSQLRYGIDPANLDQVVDDVAVVTEHEISLTNLTPNTKYYYSVGTSVSVLAEGNDYAFYTAPTVGSAQPTRVWILGDSGTANSDAAAVRDAYKTFSNGDYTDVWLMLGDNAYNSGTDTEYQNAVFDMYPEILRQSVLWPAIGNHDTSGSQNPPSDLPYFEMFTLPTNAEAGGMDSGTEKYYSFDFANIHFICLDSMTSSRSATGPMAIWLQNDLASTMQDWIIAYWHHPPYTKGSHNSDTESQLIDMRQNFLPILEAGGVDLVLSGHSHSYERSFLLDGHYGSSSTFDLSMKINGGSGRENDTGAYTKPSGGPSAHQGAVYITSGSSGKISGGLLNHPAMYVSLNNLGSVILDIDGDRLDAYFLRENPTVLDHFTILKNITNNSPSANITAPTEGATFTEGDTITITADASDSDGSVAQVDFYDELTPLSSDTTAPYEFAWNNAPIGIHQLTVMATDNQGATTESTPVNINVEAANLPPIANFTSSTSDLTANFTNTSTDSDGSIVSWSWDFGDGNTSSAQNPSHTYAAAGTYMVVLTVTDNDGAVDSANADLVVAECSNGQDCDDGNACTDDICTSGVCSNINNTSACNDELFCTAADVCNGGFCVGSGDPCAGQFCNEGTDTCDVPVCDNDGICELGEDCSNCPNDCIGRSSAGADCGNGVCEAGDGEDCVSCPDDCNGKQDGKPSGRFCCGDGDGKNPLPCSDATCSTGGWNCTEVPVGGGSYCCGDDVCEGEENTANCMIDCSCQSELDCDDGDPCTSDSCSGGVCSNNDIVICDNNDGCCPSNCDSNNDNDCSSCGIKNDPCNSDSDCCSDKCKGNGLCQ